MADVYVGCSKCGQPLPIAEEAIKTALAVGEQIPAVAHDVCPGETPVAEAAPERVFRVQIVICEIPADDADKDVFIPVPVVAGIPLELIAGLGKTVHGRNAAEAVNGPLTTWLMEGWPTLQENVARADLPAPSPAADG